MCVPSSFFVFQIKYRIELSLSVASRLSSTVLFSLYLFQKKERDGAGTKSRDDKPADSGWCLQRKDDQRKYAVAAEWCHLCLRKGFCPTSDSSQSGFPGFMWRKLGLYTRKCLHLELALLMQCLCKIIQTQIFSLSREILPTFLLQNGVIQ